MMSLRIVRRSSGPNRIAGRAAVQGVARAVAASVTAAMSMSMSMSIAMGMVGAVAGCSAGASLGDASAPSAAEAANPGGAGGGVGGIGVAASAAIGCTDPAPGVLDYIDDMEDGDAKILGRDGRVGYWYTYHDTTAGTLNPDQGVVPTMETIPGRRCGTSTRAMRVTGSGFTDWGAGLGFALRYGAGDAGVGTELPYDGSRFKGFTFWGRIGDTSIGTIRVGFGDKWSRPEGGVCTVTPTLGPNACYDTFGESFTLTTTWQRFSIEFGQLQQRSFGLARPGLDTTALMTFDVAIPPASPVFDVWIDDVAFFE
jgi:hypothetical protein